MIPRHAAADAAPDARHGPTPTLLLTLALLAVGLLPTGGGGRLHAALRSLHALEPNRVDRDREAAGYYVGLIDGGGAAGRDELALRLVGKPASFVNFAEVGANRFLERDPLQFELLPDVDLRVEGSRFTTNSLGERDRPYDRAKPPGVVRVVLLGASIDMGWGVDTDDTYENLFEDWLNHHAALRGLPRRFEVHNLAMAAYSPLHRLESYVRKAEALDPDLVLIALNRLDSRLLQIHLVGLLQEGVDPGYPFARDALARAGLDPSGDAARRLDKEAVKAQLQPHLPALYEATLAELARRCRDAGRPLVALAVPRASEDDGPESRAADMARLAEIAGRLAIPLVDLMAALDEEDPGDVEIAPWDDHPNDRGHKLIFRLLARRVVDDAALYRLLFATEPTDIDALRAAAARTAREEGHDRTDDAPASR